MKIIPAAILFWGIVISIYNNSIMIMWIVKFITEKTDLGAALFPLLVEVESEENSM